MMYSFLAYILEIYVMLCLWNAESHSLFAIWVAFILFPSLLDCSSYTILLVVHLSMDKYARDLHPSPSSSSVWHFLFSLSLPAICDTSSIHIFSPLWGCFGWWTRQYACATFSTPSSWTLLFIFFRAIWTPFHTLMYSVCIIYAWFGFSRNAKHLAMSIMTTK